MVVIASLIGAKGLGQDVLIALQYAAKGQGMLAGLAILFCAMVIDRIIPGPLQALDFAGWARALGRSAKIRQSQAP